MTEADRVLSVGLVTGYGGGTDIKKGVKRGAFEVTVSAYASPQGDDYQDEWTGSGGQEIARAKDGSESTRVYAGQVLKSEKLAELGLTSKDVIKKLKLWIVILGEATRLDKTCHPEPDGDWTYSYDILEKDTDGIPLTIAKELIRYQGVVVFKHGFMKSPIK